MHARAGSAGHLSAAATATSDLDITVLTHDSGRHPAHQTGATAGRRPDRRAAGSAAPGAGLDFLPGRETLADLRDRASARRRPANHAPVRQVQQRLRPARIEELIAAYRRGATAAALAVQFQIHRRTVAALLQRQKIGSKSSG